MPTPPIIEALSDANDALGTLLDDHHERFTGSDRVALEDAMRVVRSMEQELGE